MDAKRELWNNGRQQLRRALTGKDYSKAIEQFLIQHALVHSKKVSHMEAWSFEDQLWRGLTKKMFRVIPPNGEHSIAWIIFHIGRIEDITMNMLIAKTPQLYLRDGWAKKTKIPVPHSANRMDDAGVARLSSTLDINALREYRLAVGRRTRFIVKRFSRTNATRKLIRSTC